MRVPLRVTQACAYCFEPFETQMIPIQFSSRRSVNSSVYLHVRCAKEALGRAKADFDFDDMSVDVDIDKLGGEGWVEMDDPPAR